MTRSIRPRRVRRQATLLLELLEARELLDADAVPGVGPEPDTGLPPFPYDEVDRQVMYDDLLNIEDPIASERTLDFFLGGTGQLVEMPAQTTGGDLFFENAPAFPDQVAEGGTGAFPIEMLDREFMVFDDIRLAGEPNLVEDFGLQPLQRFSQWYFWAPGADDSEPDVDRIRENAQQYLDPRWFFVANIEHWPTYGDEAVVSESIRKLALVVDTIKEVHPDIVTGIYGMMPVRDYFTPVRYDYDSPEFEEWTVTNARLQELADHVDVILPSIYTFYPDYAADGTPRIWERDRWVQYATANLLQARQYGKPVVSYIWPHFHGGGGSADPDSPDYRYWKYQPIGRDFWEVILETTYQYSDSTVIYEGLPKAWDDTAPWWLATEEFLSEVVPARVQGESTVYGTVTVGDLRETWTNDNATVTITVNSVNEPPVAQDDWTVIADLSPVTLNVMADNGSGADADPDGTLVASTTVQVSGPSQGTLTNHQNGTFTYTPSESFSGTDSFTYQISDDEGASSNIATVTIAWNTPPIARDDLIYASEDTPQIIDVLQDNSLEADSDPDGELDPTSISLISGPNSGTLVRNSDGTFLYTPNLDFVGVDHFRYTVADLFGAVSNVAKVTIRVEDANESPLAQDDLVQTEEDTPLTIDVLLDHGNGVDYDPDGTLAASTTIALSSPSHGTLTNNGDGTFRYAPSWNYYGSDSFTYQVSDSEGTPSNSATVRITVTDVNDAPVARNDQLTTPRNTTLTIDVLLDHGSGADVDLDGQLTEARLVLESGPAHGTLSSGGSGVGIFEYVPETDFSGTDSFQYQVLDDDGAISNAATVTIVVNTPPVAQDDELHTDEDSVVAMDVLADNGSGADTDEDGTLQAATIAIVDPPTHGDLTSMPDGTFEYNPDLDFAGSDSFTYTVADDDGAVSNVATVTMVVGQVNDAPLARDDEAATTVGEPIVIDILVDNGHGPDLDIDGVLMPATTTVIDEPSEGELVNNGDGTLRYVPLPDYAGTVQFTYTIQDDQGASSELATVTIQVSEVNLAPVARDDEVQTEEDTPLTIEVLPDSGSGADYDPDGTLVASTTVAVDEPLHGTLVNHGDGTFTYTPDENFDGTDGFTYRVSDDEGLPSNLANVTITITEVNDPPVAHRRSPDDATQCLADAQSAHGPWRRSRL